MHSDLYWRPLCHTTRLFEPRQIILTQPMLFLEIICVRRAYALSKAFSRSRKATCKVSRSSHYFFAKKRAAVIGSVRVCTDQVQRREFLTNRSSRCVTSIRSVKLPISLAGLHFDQLLHAFYFQLDRCNCLSSVRHNSFMFPANSGVRRSPIFFRRGFHALDYRSSYLIVPFLSSCSFQMCSKYYTSTGTALVKSSKFSQNLSFHFHCIQLEEHGQRSCSCFYDQRENFVISNIASLFLSLLNIVFLQ